MHELLRLSTGIPRLDIILGGGLVEGASYIVQGQPGAGKTIFSNQVAFANVSKGGKVLYVTLFAETHDRLFQSLGTLEFFDRSQLGTNITYVSVFQTLRDEGLSAVVSLIRQEIARQVQLCWCSTACSTPVTERIPTSMRRPSSPRSRARPHSSAAPSCF